MMRVGDETHTTLSDRCNWTTNDDGGAIDDGLMMKKAAIEGTMKEEWRRIDNKLLKNN